MTRTYTIETLRNGSALITKGSLDLELDSEGYNAGGSLCLFGHGYNDTDALKAAIAAGCTELTIDQESDGDRAARYADLDAVEAHQAMMAKVMAI